MQNKKTMKEKVINHKLQKGEKSVHSRKKKIVNESDDEDVSCMCIYCLKSYNQSNKSTCGRDWKNRLDSMS